VETFRWNPVGTQSHPAKPGQQPEVSLAWRAVTHGTKRRQRACRAAPWSLESFIVAGAHAVPLSGGRIDPLEWPEGVDPAGVRERGVRARGFPGNLGGLSLSTVAIGFGVAEPKAVQAHRSCVSGRWERTRRRNEWYRRAKRKAWREGGQESERPRSTREAGERCPRGPRGGKGGVE